MFKNLDEFLKEGAPLSLDQTGMPTGRDEQVATIALLLDIAHVDQSLDGTEFESIMRSMYRAFGLTEIQSGEIFEIAELLRREKSRTEQFVAAINEHFSAEQREHLLHLVWLVLKADGRADTEENSFAATLRKRLGLSMEQAIRARKLAEEADFLRAAIIPPVRDE